MFGIQVGSLVSGPSKYHQIRLDSISASDQVDRGNTCLGVRKVSDGTRQRKSACVDHYLRPGIHRGRRVVMTTSVPVVCRHMALFSLVRFKTEEETCLQADKT